MDQLKNLLQMEKDFKCCVLLGAFTPREVEIMEGMGDVKPYTP